MVIFLNRKPLLTSFFFLDRAPGQESKKKKWRQASLLVNLLLSFLKIKKLGSFSKELHNFSICKLDSHGSSIYLAIQDSGGHHSSLILCRRIFRRAWRTWLIQFIKVRQPKIILFCSKYLFLLILIIFAAFNVLYLKKHLEKGPLKSAHIFHFKHKYLCK